MKRILPVLVVLLALPGAVSAATLQAGSGQAYSTIQAAINAASPGDTIQVHPGTYHEGIVIDKSGLTIEAYDPTNPPELDGADQNFNPTWTKVPGWDHIYRTDYQWYKPQITDQEFTTYTGGRLRAAMEVYEDDHILRGYRNKNNPYYLDEFYPAGTGVEWWGMGGAYRQLSELDPANDPTKEECESYCENRTLGGYCSDRDCNPGWSVKPNIHITGRFLYDEANTDLYVWSEDGGNPSNHKYYIPVIFNLVQINANDVTLRNLVITHSSGFAIAIEYVSGTVIEDSYLISNRHDIWIKSSRDVTITRNFFQDKGFWERYWYGDCKRTVLHGGDIEVQGGTSSSNIEISKNTFSEAYSMIHPADGELKVFGNIFGNAMSVHMSASAYGMEVYGNVFHNIDDNSIGVSNIGLGQPNYVYRNVFYADRTITKDGGQDTPEEGMLPFYFYHNTIAMSGRISNHPYAYPPYKTTHYLNNIVYLRHKSMEMYWSYVDKDSSKGWTYYPFDNGPESDYNLFWRNPNLVWNQIARFRNENDPLHYYTEGQFSVMQSQTGLETHSTEADPKFVHGDEFKTADVFNLGYDTFSTMYYKDVISQGYMNLYNQHFPALYHYFDVQPDSPAVDFGEVLPGDWPDTVSVQDGMPDAGAVEYGASCSPSWSCSAWSAWSSCSANQQTRTRSCTDLNSCIPDYTDTDTQSCNTTPAEPSIVARWTFDEGSGSAATDSSGNGNDGVLVNGPAWTAGKTGNALHFDGVDDYVQAPDSSSLNPSYLTVSLWFRPDDMTDNTGLIAKGDNSHRQYWVWIYQDSLSLEIGSGGHYNNVFPLDTGTWHHLAVTFDGSDIVTYVNGNEISSIPQTTGLILADNDPLLIGKLPGYTSFSGTIDDVRIYNYALTNQQVQSLYHDTEGLVLHLQLDEGSGSAATDSSGNGNDGVLVNGPAWTAGKTGNALHFDGVDDYVQAPDSSSLDFPKSQGTLMMWIRPENPSSGNYQGLFVDQGFSMELSIQADGDLYFYPWVDSSFNDYNLVTNPFTSERWSHIAVTWDYSTKTVKIYVDGTEMPLEVENVPSYWTNVASTSGWQLGGSPINNRFFSGTMDDVRVYSYAMDPQDINAIANPHRADTSGDGCIDMAELMAFRDLWYMDSTTNTMPELMEAVGLYNAGTGCPN